MSNVNETPDPAESKPGESDETEPGSAEPEQAKDNPDGSPESAETAHDIVIDYAPIGRQGRVRITVKFPDGSSYTDRVDVTSSRSREAFLKRLLKDREGVDEELLDAELEKITASVVEANESYQPESQAAQLVALAEDALLFHTPGGHDSEGYAAIEFEDRREVWPINARAFKRWLARKFHEIEGGVPGSQALQDALNVVAGKAIYEGPEHEVFVRIACIDETIFLDLADAQWRVVEVTKTGWRVVAGNTVPVRFVRRPGMLPIPAPVPGGSVDELRLLVNVPDEKSWVLLVACVVAYLRARGPYPILIVDGEQGSAKSTLCRIVLLLIDPRKAGLRRPPREERDLMIAASNSLVVGFDNLSSLASWISDSICSLATGGGFSARQLYTDDEEKLFDAMRPVLLNGIENVASRSDLLDRAVHLHLPTISEDKRMAEKVLWARFEEMRARVLGALLDAVVLGLRTQDEVTLDSSPRMIDFATWATACEPALGWKPGTFMAAYVGNRQEAHELAVETSPVGPSILGLMHDRASWEGSARELLANLENHHADEKTKARRDWPKTSRGMSEALARVAPNLRALGLEVTHPPRTGHSRPVRLEWAEGRAPRALSPGSDGPPAVRDGCPLDDRHCENGPGGAAVAVRDGDDGRDDHLPTQSKDAIAGVQEVAEWSA